MCLKKGNVSRNRREKQRGCKKSKPRGPTKYLSDCVTELFIKLWLGIP
jgi:hypothetical protein